MIDFLIIGGGHAGMHTAFAAMQRKCSFVLVDPFEENATNISAGIINPITGRKYKPQWHIEVLLPFAERIYAAMERQLETSILHHSGIWKMHKSEEALEAWLMAGKTPETMTWVSEDAEQHAWQKHLDHRFGAIQIPKAKRVDTTAMMNAFRKIYAENCMKESINYAELEVHDDHITWKGEKYRHIVFCEGSRVMQNPWFGHISLWPAKGECLIAHIPHLKLNVILQKKVFIVPFGSDIYWIGASNDFTDATYDPTQAKLDELTEGLRDMLNLPYKIIAHRAGLRPTMRDRTPVVGTHPLHKSLHILNGLGTKGSLLAPYYAHILLDDILHNTGIPAPADVQRTFR